MRCPADVGNCCVQQTPVKTSIHCTVCLSCLELGDRPCTVSEQLIDCGDVRVDVEPRMNFPRLAWLTAFPPKPRRGVCRFGLGGQGLNTGWLFPDAEEVSSR